MKQSFVNKIIIGAKEGYQNHGILPSLVIAQAILESGWGRSDLANKANNLFGIKADSSWKGEKVLAPTKEYIYDEWINTQAYFRKYKTLDDSILDHAKFLNKPRYEKVRQAKTYKEACEEIYEAKYATDPNYPNKLIKIIEENKLYKYDEDLGDGFMYKLYSNAGHGGRDPGASGHGYKEKDLALKMSLDVEKKTMSKTDDIKFIQSRTSDKYMSLGEITNHANSLDVDTFLAYHLNSASNNTAKGLETFCYPSSNKGNELASFIQDELVKDRLCLSDRGVKQAKFYVLKHTKMPSALCELCFINNKEDLDFLLSNWDRFVDSISTAIMKYFNVKTSKEDLNKIEAPVKPIANIVKDKINIMLIGEHVATEGFIKEGTSYVDVNGSYISIREILEKLHLEVDWDNELKFITADTTGTFINEEGLTDILLLGNKINVKTYIHEDKNCLKIDNAYIPIRDIFESLGFVVKWNDVDKMIWIDK